MDSTSFILATAGHVDHGKSALVRALTGTDPDRLPQEKARGITIDLGFAHLSLTNGGRELSVGVIDVPGHEDFVKNMVAGVGSVDLALLAVAADDGWMPQTEEHLHILTYLGVSRIVVALTKCDLADPDGAEARLRLQLAGSRFEKAPVVRTSCRTGAGLEDLRNCLAGELAALPPPRDTGKPRLAVDRAFTLKGLGTIVTGTLTGGKIRSGENVLAWPGRLPLRVRRIQNHHCEASEAGPGQRAALNLPEAAVQHRAGDGGLARGHVITGPDAGEAARIFDIQLTRLARLPADAPSLRHGEQLRVHHGSGSTAARVYLKTAGMLAPGSSVMAQLRLAAPMLIFTGDRLVLRDASARHTLAGGLVLDAGSTVPGFRTGAQQVLLASRARFPDDPLVYVRTHLVRYRLAHFPRFAAASGFSADQIRKAVEALTARGEAVTHGGMAAGAGWWRKLTAAAGALIEAEHRAHPNLPGLDLGKLAAALGRDVQPPGVLDALVADLCRNGFGKVRHAIRKESHQTALPAPLQAAGARVLAALEANPFDPPSGQDLAPDPASREALRYFRETGQVVELAAGVAVTAEAFRRMKEILAEFLTRNGPSKVSDLRTCLGSSRRVMIPFLERCDREGFTRRQGDLRALGNVRKV